MSEITPEVLHKEIKGPLLQTKITNCRWINKTSINVQDLTILVSDEF